MKQNMKREKEKEDFKYEKTKVGEEKNKHEEKGCEE